MDLCSLVTHTYLSWNYVPPLLILIHDQTSPGREVKKMKKRFGIPVLLVFFTLLFSAGTKEVSEVCTADADCKGGICFDLSQIDDVCKGKVCTVPCTQNADCPKVDAEPQCNKQDGKKICQYGAWDKKYCQ